MDDVRALDWNLLLTGTESNNDNDDNDDDKYSLLSPKERLRCVSEMEKSVDSSAVIGADGTSNSGSGMEELMMRCVRAMQSKRLMPSYIITAATSSEVHCCCF